MGKRQKQFLTLTLLALLGIVGLFLSQKVRDTCTEKSNFQLYYHKKNYDSFKQLEEQEDIIRSQPMMSTPLISIVMPKGRLGNQMFAYAAGYGIARTHNRPFQYIKQNNTKLKQIFFINEKSVEYDEGMTSTRDHVQFLDQWCCTFNPVLLHLPPVNVVITGNLQSYKYFSKYKSEILQQFNFRHHNQNSPHTFIQKIKDKHKNAAIIGIHIRRGDMSIKNDQGYVVPDKTYYEKAIKYLEEKLQTRTVFIVCTEEKDIDWAKNNLPVKTHIFEFIENHSAIFDMELLSLCDHLIISVGTFGWWSAYLNQGMGNSTIVLYYKGFAKLGSPLYKAFSPITYFLPHWIGFLPHWIGSHLDLIKRSLRRFRSKGRFGPLNDF